MIRPGATWIQLDHKDLNWHKNRFDQRKLEHDTSIASASPTHGKSRAAKPHRIAIAPSNTCPFRRHDGGTILARGQTPRNSDVFWNGILAHAPSPLTGLRSLQQSIEHDSETVADGPSSPESLYTTAQSEPPTRDDSTEQSDNNDRHEDARQDSSTEDDAGSTIIRRLPSQVSRSSSKGSEGSVADDESDIPTIRRNHQDQPSTHPRSPLPSTARSLSREQRQLSRPYQYAGPFPNDGAEDGPSTSSNMPRIALETVTLGEVRRHTASYHANADIEAPESYGDLDIDNVHASSSDRPVLPSVERLRGRSGTYLRSPLRISQAAPSSSPERRPVETIIATGTEPGSSTPRLLQLPPRRSLGTSVLGSSARDSVDDDEGSPERRRLEQFSPVSDSEMQSSAANIRAGSAFSQRSRATGSGEPPSPWSPSSRATETQNDVSSSSSRPSSRRSSRSTSFDANDPHNYQPNGASTPVRRAYSSTHYLSRSRRHGRPRAQPLPPANYYIVPIPPAGSSNGDTPSSPPTQQYTSLPVASPSPSASNERSQFTQTPSTPQRSSRTSRIFRTPSHPGRRNSSPQTPGRQIRVYDDSQPPASQPQTPVGLARHGVPPMSIRGSWTAPAPRRYARLPRPGARAVDGLIDSYDVLGGRRAAESNDDQENLSTTALVEQRRAVLDEEVHGDVGNGGRVLDQTPPGMARWMSR